MDDRLSGKKADYETIISMINADNRLDKNGKILLLSAIQLHKEVYTAPEVIELSKTLNKSQVSLRNGCDCPVELALYILKQGECDRARAADQATATPSNPYPAPSYLTTLKCNEAQVYNLLYLSCKNKIPTVCPGGFSYDGANCYSGLHFPSGYNGFVWGNGFYTQQNCNISTSNNCCPAGFGYDGANCHFWGLYFPSNYEAFIWNNTFYVKPKCQ
jgi:hypothetical protein